MLAHLYESVPLVIMIAVSAPRLQLSRAAAIHRMYNPKTYQELTRAARDQNHGSDASFLAIAVKVRKDTEAQGIVRKNHPVALLPLDQNRRFWLISGAANR
jgi:hypothetical protein